ncbi:hypothetical protein RRG08_013195 [Elysia crispata]|uniref:Uncharacterized protein n=1 Tax=Elysia crispata TaxID=231223 RepID=A0AAE1B567_9GAST|nr:hypothetical protein RRG08_013195 [Elysia crispata]
MICVSAFVTSDLTKPQELTGSVVPTIDDSDKTTSHHQQPTRDSSAETFPHPRLLMALNEESHSNIHMSSGN